MTEEGEVSGALHAIRAVLDLDGQQHVDMGLPERDLDEDYGLPPFQQEGVATLLSYMEQGFLLNDDVGLGKTVQTIAAAVQQPKLVKVVMCPAFLRQQWQGEIERWVPKFGGEAPRIHVVWPKSDRRSTKLQPAEPDWVLCYYLDIDRALEVVGRKRSYLLIIDEVHNLRGYKSARLESVQAAATFASARIGLTASAMYNNASKMFTVLDAVEPGAWGSYWNPEQPQSSYAGRYCSATQGDYGIVLGNLSNVPEFRRRYELMHLRRVKGDVYDQLPFDAKFTTVWLDMPGARANRIAMAMSGKAGFDNHLTQTAAFKVGPVVDQIKSDVASDVPSITFTYLREQAKSISALLPQSMLVLGGDNAAVRLARIAQYVARCKATSIAPHLIGTLDSLSEGANLQWAKVINLAALSNAPDQVKQAVGRAARMGQTGTVQVRIFACRYTYDERLVEILRHKLSEQFKMDGRKEKEKLDLDTALAPSGQKSALRAMYERAREEEANDSR